MQPIRICTALAVAGLMVHGPTPPASADPLPDKDSSATFAFSHSLGFSDGQLYLYTGDSIYTVDPTNPANPTFTLHMSSLESAFTEGPRPADGSMSFGPGGTGMITFGFEGRGVLSVDLISKTTTEVADYNEANVFSFASNSAGTFFGQYADSDNFTTSTRIDRIDPVTLDVSTLGDPGDLSSGGMAFLPNGDLIVSTFDFGVWPDPIGTANFYRVTAADLALFESDGTTPTLIDLGGGPSNGSGVMVADADGLIYFNTSTGIGRFDPDTGTLTNFLGDILDENIYSYDGFNLPLNGLAYDAANDRLVYAVSDGAGQYELAFANVPEPATVSVLTLMGLLLIKRRQPG